MKFYAILLCIAIGSVFGELQQRKFGKEKLEVTEDANEARSLISLDDRRKTYSSDESLPVNNAQDISFDQIAANTKDADPVEKETPRNPSPVIDTSTVKSTSSKAIKKNLEILYIRKPARKEANLVSNSRRFLRRKRMAEVEDPTNPIESYKMYKKVREKLPEQLRMKTRKTDAAEEKLLTSYATSNGDTSNLIADYNSAKSAEREQLKVDASGSGATEVIDNYKALRKGKPWNYIKLRGKLQGLFGKPSPSLTEYETLKQDEVASIDSFLGGSSNVESGKATNVQPQEKEKPTEEKVTNAPSKENETPADEKDWLSTEPAEINPVQEIPYRDDDRIVPDSALSAAWIDTNKNIDETNSWNESNRYSEEKQYMLANDRGNSSGRYWKYFFLLNRDLSYPMVYSDDCERALLSYSADAGKFRKAYLDLYYEYRKKEIEALKAYLASKPENIRERVLLIYKCIRKGKPWYWMKGEFPVYKFFSGSIPKPVMDKYLAVKKEELYTDQYLDGSMKIGEVSKKDENTKAEASEKPSSQNENPKAPNVQQPEATEKPAEEKVTNVQPQATAEVAQVARAEEDEKAEEMERGVRAKETETVEAEYDDYREHIENIFATSDDVKEDVEVHGSPDNVTSADVRNTENTTDKKTKENSHLLRFAILFAMVMQLIIAILILAPQRDKLVEWCKRKKRTESDPSETEPLQAGEKVFPTGPTSKVLKVSSQRRPDVADANQRARV